MEQLAFPFPPPPAPEPVVPWKCEQLSFCLCEGWHVVGELARIDLSQSWICRCIDPACNRWWKHTLSHVAAMVGASPTRTCLTPGWPLPAKEPEWSASRSR